MAARVPCKRCRKPTTFGKTAPAERVELGLCSTCYSLIESERAREAAGRPTWFEGHNIDELPDPRPDGLCANCYKKPVVTRDRRFCQSCLSLLVRLRNPGSVALHSRRTRDQKQAWDQEPSPATENAIRALEDE
jgi:hypothetical protein